MATKLYPYQREGVRLLHKFHGVALEADEMGLGKSIQFLKYAVELGRVPVVVVCPPGLRLNWEKEMRTHIGVRAEILYGRKPPRRWQPSSDFLIIGDNVLAAWLDKLLSIGVKIIGVDECHRFKNRGAKRTKAVKLLSRHVKRKIFMSGTPLTNNAAELFPVLNMLWPKVYRSFFVFASEFCKMEYTYWGPKFHGVKNVKRLNKQLRKRGMIRRRKKDVLEQLPAVTQSVVPVEISNWKEYREAYTNFIGWLTKISPAKAMKARRSQQLTRVGYLKRLVAKLKMNAVCEWVDNFLEESDGKLLLFGIHKKTIRRLFKRYKRIARVIDGSKTKEERRDAEASFQNDKRVRILIGNMDAMGVGLNLTAASAVAIFELPWTPDKLSQAWARAHRIGQLNRVFVYYLVAKGTVEERHCEILISKQEVFDGAIDGAEPTENTMSVFNQFIAELTKKGKHNGAHKAKSR